MSQPVSAFVPAKPSAGFALAELGPATDREISAKIKARIEGAKKIALVGHERPDGDCIGSLGGLCAILRLQGFDATAYSCDPVPARFKFLKIQELVKLVPRGVRLEGDLALVLDTTELSRSGAPVEGHFKPDAIVNIDHHISNLSFGGLNWVDTGAAAAGELVWRLASCCGWRAPLDAFEALYTAILTDTGQFSYGNTNARVLRMSAEMVDAGLSPEKLWQKIYLGKSRPDMELEARARASLETWAAGKIALISLTSRDFSETCTGLEAAGEFASIPRYLAGVELALFFYEINEGRATKISLRSMSHVDVNALAKEFGGGGHKQAAGCAIMTPLDEAKFRMKAAAERAIKKQ